MDLDETIQHLSALVDKLTSQVVITRSMRNALLDDWASNVSIVLEMPGGNCLSLHDLGFADVFVGNGTIQLVNNLLAGFEAKRLDAIDRLEGLKRLKPDAAAE